MSDEDFARELPNSLNLLHAKFMGSFYSSVTVYQNTKIELI